MTEHKKELIHKAVDKAFEYYLKRGYDDHLTQPQIIEDSKQIAEKLAETRMHEGKGFDYIASIASFVSCESRGCPINLRMAKDTSEHKIKTKDLRKAREITGIEPKLKAEDWIDGVVRTLKNRHIISDKQESKIIEKTALEIPNVQKGFSPRYKTIIAAYRALRNSGIKVTHEDMHYIFNISAHFFQNPLEGIDFKRTEKDVAKLFRENPETLYRPKEIVEILQIDMTPVQMGNFISERRGRLDVLSFHKGVQSYYGISNICGHGECYEIECGNDEMQSCRLGPGKRNTKLKFYSQS